VRFRSDYEGDFGRMRRQQQVLSAIGKRMMQPQTILRLPALLEQFAQDVRTDLTLPQLMSVSQTLTRDFDTINMIQLRGTPTTINRISYVILDEDFLRDTVHRYIRWQNGNTENPR